MVEFFIRWNWAFRDFIGNSVRLMLPIISCEVSISVGVPSTQPKPATIIGATLDFLPKPFIWRFITPPPQDDIGRAMFHKPCIVHITEIAGNDRSGTSWHRTNQSWHLSVPYLHARMPAIPRQPSMIPATKLLPRVLRDELLLAEPTMPYVQVFSLRRHNTNSLPLRCYALWMRMLTQEPPMGQGRYVN